MPPTSIAGVPVSPDVATQTRPHAQTRSDSTYEVAKPEQVLVAGAAGAGGSGWVMTVVARDPIMCFHRKRTSIRAREFS